MKPLRIVLVTIEAPIPSRPHPDLDRESVRQAVRS